MRSALYIDREERLFICKSDLAKSLKIFTAEHGNIYDF